MKRILPALVAISLLAAPAAAHAKRLSSATVCGSSGCNDSSHPAALLPIMEGGPPIAGGPTRAHPFYRMRVVVAEGRASDSINLIVVPHDRLVRGPDEMWRETSTTAIRGITTLARRLRPFSASELPGVQNVSRLSHPDTAPATPGPTSAAPDSSFPWLAVGVGAVGLLLVSGLAIGLRRARGLAMRARGSE
jgi:hypothetical protein